jgi:hypothetical protein
MLSGMKVAQKLAATLIENGEVRAKAGMRSVCGASARGARRIYADRSGSRLHTSSL